MRKRRLLCTLVFFILPFIFELPNVVQAQSSATSNGLLWLTASQSAAGNWPEVSTTDYYSTAAALDAAYILQPTSFTYTSGIQWMSTQIASPTDYLSRQIIALKRSGQDTAGYVSSLLLYRNSDGGFGGAEDCPNSYILDTALALQALHAANYSDNAVLYQAINYLTTNQNSDGGWGFVPGNESNTYVTAIVLRSLSAYNTLFINQDSINKAAAYLLTKQNSDYGFGSSPSTIYETALSIMALIESGQTGQAGDLPLRNAINTSPFLNIRTVPGTTIRILLPWLFRPWLLPGRTFRSHPFHYPITCPRTAGQLQ